MFQKYGYTIFSFLIAIIVTSLAGCDDATSRFPSELKLTQKIYEKKQDHLFGPGGINHGVRIYKLPEDVAEAVTKSGLDFLDNLPSVAHIEKQPKPTGSSSGPYVDPFKSWQKTPVIKNDKWIRRSYIKTNDTKPALSEFLGQTEGKSEFLAAIPQDTQQMINRIIQSEGSYYVYGGYRDMEVLIISPADKIAIYLNRD